MPATFDAATDVVAGAGTAISTTHTAGGSDRALYVGGGAVDAAPNLVSSGTYDGVAMTERADAVFATFYTHFGLTLVNPATGAKTVTVNYAGTNDDSSMAIVSANGVDQTTPFGTPNSATGNSASPSISIVSAVDDLVVANLIFVGGGTATHGTDQTERTSNTNVAAGEFGHYTTTKAGAATSTTMSHGITSANWAMNGIAFKAAAGGPTLIAASDTLAPGITDAVSAIAATLAVSDTLTPGITDALSSIAATLAESDVLATGVTDAVSNILATLAVSNTVTVQVVDASALLAALSASDSLAPGVTDAASVTILASTLGKMIAIIAVKPALAGDASTDAALGAAPDVKPGIGGKPTLH